MPYLIRKVSKNKYQVLNKQTGKIHAKHTSKEKAEAQVRLLKSLERKGGDIPPNPNQQEDNPALEPVEEDPEPEPAQLDFEEDRDLITQRYNYVENLKNQILRLIVEDGGFQPLTDLHPENLDFNELVYEWNSLENTIENLSQQTGLSGIQIQAILRYLSGIELDDDFRSRLDYVILQRNPILFNNFLPMYIHI